MLQLIALVLACCLLSAPQAATAGDAGAPNRMAVLAYHRFNPEAPAAMTVTDATFESELAWLSTHHYRVVRLRELVDALQGRTPPIEGPAVAICADDGHQTVYSQMYPIIRREHIPITLFIYPSAISNASYAMTWDQLREMEQSGLVEVQSHTYWHPNFKQEKARRNPDDYRRFVDMQLQKSKQVLEKRMGHPIDLLAWPFGIYDADLEAAAARAGYRAAFALDGRVAGPSSDLFAIPRFLMTDADTGTRFARMVTTATETHEK